MTEAWLAIGSACGTSALDRELGLACCHRQAGIYGKRCRRGRGGDPWGVWMFNGKILDTSQPINTLTSPRPAAASECVGR